MYRECCCELEIYNIPHTHTHPPITHAPLACQATFPPPPNLTTALVFLLALVFRKAFCFPLSWLLIVDSGQGFCERSSPSVAYLLAYSTQHNIGLAFFLQQYQKHCDCDCNCDDGDGER